MANWPCTVCLRAWTRSLRPKQLREFSPFPQQRGPQACLAATHWRRPRQQLTRPLHASAGLLKKGGKGGKGAHEPSAKSSSSSSGNDDPFDVTELQAGITRAEERLRDELGKLRAGGRFNPEILDNLRVGLVKGTKETVRLGDLAQVVPKGRVVNIVVGEKDYVKPVAATIQSANLNLTPQADAHNPLQLNIQLPPPTTDARQAAVRAAQAAGEAASTVIRTARQAQQKRLRAIQLGKAARPDDLKKAGDKMEKVVEGGNAEVKKMVDAARRVLESG